MKKLLPVIFTLFLIFAIVFTGSISYDLYFHVKIKREFIKNDSSAFDYAEEVKKGKVPIDLLPIAVEWIRINDQKQPDVLTKNRNLHMAIGGLRSGTLPSKQAWAERIILTPDLYLYLGGLYESPDLYTPVFSGITCICFGGSILLQVLWIILKKISSRTAEG